MTPETLANQIRSARAWLDWSREDLAKKAGIAANTIAGLERGDGTSEPNARTLAKIMNVFEQAGIEMTDDGGIRPRVSRVSYFTGADGFRRFFDDVYETIKKHPNPDVCLANVDEDLFAKWHGKENDLNHIKRMNELNLPRYKVLLKENDFKTRSLEYCDFRWIKNNQFADTCIYIFGGKTAFIDFEENTVTATLVDSPNVSQALRRMFEASWQNSLPVGVQA